MTDRFEGTRMHLARARRTLATGVPTAIRAGQLPMPLCFSHGEGAYLTDVDGNRYVDLALAYGPMLLGHSPQPVVDAVHKQLDELIGHGGTSRVEAELAEAVCRTVPSAELTVFSSTGSEAAAAAIRIARAATGRLRVIKFLGHYHGWLDGLHVGTPGHPDAGPGTAGQDPAAAAAVTVCRWNDIPALQASLADDVAAVIMEPVHVNAGCLAPEPGYLEAVRELTAQRGIVLIFDEVITGYRLALGGAQERFGVTPDLTVLGKALGAGLPISAVCGRRDVMDVVASGTMQHIGTFNMNPLCASAALAAVTTMESEQGSLYPQLEHAGAELAAAVRAAARETGYPLAVNQIGAAAYGFVSSTPVRTYEDALGADTDAYRRFTELLAMAGVYAPARGLLYVSSAHGPAELERVRAAMTSAASALARDPVS
jgi:glutamate-1-semialdehyde 2,1-aminomutase